MLKLTMVSECAAVMVGESGSLSAEGRVLARAIKMTSGQDDASSAAYVSCLPHVTKMAGQ